MNRQQRRAELANKRRHRKRRTTPPPPPPIDDDDDGGGDGYGGEYPHLLCCRHVTTGKATTWVRTLLTSDEVRDGVPAWLLCQACFELGEDSLIAKMRAFDKSSRAARSPRQGGDDPPFKPVCECCLAQDQAKTGATIRLATTHEMIRYGYQGESCYHVGPTTESVGPFVEWDSPLGMLPASQMAAVSRYADDYRAELASRYGDFMELSGEEMVVPHFIFPDGETGKLCGKCRGWGGLSLAGMKRGATQDYSRFTLGIYLEDGAYHNILVDGTTQAPEPTFFIKEQPYRWPILECRTMVGRVDPSNGNLLS